MFPCWLGDAEQRLATGAMGWRQEQEERSGRRSGRKGGCSCLCQLLEQNLARDTDAEGVVLLVSDVLSTAQKGKEGKEGRFRRKL